MLTFAKSNSKIKTRLTTKRAVDLAVRPSPKAESNRGNFSVSLVSSPVHQRVTQTSASRRVMTLFC
jgi:hypothetical protein